MTNRRQKNCGLLITHWEIFKNETSFVFNFCNFPNMFRRCIRHHQCDGFNMETSVESYSAQVTMHKLHHEQQARERKLKCCKCTQDLKKI